MSMDYQDYVNTVANIALVNPIDAAFQAVIPTMINYAEMRIYRELNLLETVTRNDSNTLTSNSRTFTVPSEFVVVEGMNVITPVGAASADAARIITVRVMFHCSGMHFQYSVARNSLSALPQTRVYPIRRGSGKNRSAPTKSAVYRKCHRSLSAGSRGQFPCRHHLV